MRRAKKQLKPLEATPPTPAPLLSRAPLPGPRPPPPKRNIPPTRPPSLTPSQFLPCRNIKKNVECRKASKQGCARRLFAVPV